jgi:hypothetical protein
LVIENNYQHLIKYLFFQKSLFTFLNYFACLELFELNYSAMEDKQHQGEVLLSIADLSEKEDKLAIDQ